MLPIRLKFLSLLMGFLFASGQLVWASTSKLRTIEVRTEKKEDGAVYWVPEKIKVNPGEEIQFVVKHNLEGGFDFHGFDIKELKIKEQVNRNKVKTIKAKIPETLSGEIKIGCHFHPAHKPATLEITPKK